MIHLAPHVQEISRLLHLGFGFGLDRGGIDYRFVLGVRLSTAQTVRALKLAVQRAPTESTGVDESRRGAEREKESDAEGRRRRRSSSFARGDHGVWRLDERAR
jgi:hypothetical protein